MNTKVMLKKVELLSRDINLLKSLIISVVEKDTEGRYKESFIKKILKAANREPTDTFTTGKKFLEKVRQV